MDATFQAMTDPTYLILLFFVCFGMICCFATFVFMMPIVANTILGVFSTVFGERTISKIRGKESGTEVPPELDADYRDPLEA